MSVTTTAPARRPRREPLDADELRELVAAAAILEALAIRCVRPRPA